MPKMSHYCSREPPYFLKTINKNTMKRKRYDDHFKQTLNYWDTSAMTIITRLWLVLQWYSHKPSMMINGPCRPQMYTTTYASSGEYMLLLVAYCDRKFIKLYQWGECNANKISVKCLQRRASILESQRKAMSSAIGPLRQRTRPPPVPDGGESSQTSAKTQQNREPTQQVYLMTSNHAD